MFPIGRIANVGGDCGSAKCGQSTFTQNDVVESNKTQVVIIIIGGEINANI